MSDHCAYNAPYFGIELLPNRYFVVQGNCHHWDCPKCGLGRASQEYGRIVEGCRQLTNAGHKLYFLTITCRGKELSVQDALDNYLAWTSKFLDAAYTYQKRAGGHWTYVQVTELQERGHPHSHILTTFRPSDPIWGTKWTLGDHNGKYEWYEKECWRSDWMANQVIKSGLGKEYDISIVDSAEGASRYVAKYLFKPEMSQYKFPKRWKRVRYAQTFPKLEKRKGKAYPLITREDWQSFIENVDEIVVKSEERESIERKMRWIDTYAAIIERDNQKQRDDDEIAFAKIMQKLNNPPA